MGFKRVLISDDGKMPQSLRAGDGMVGNVGTPGNVLATATLTLAQVNGGHIIHTVTLAADATYTLPTAAALAAAWPSMDIGDSYSFFVTNSQAAAFDVVVAVGVGITAIGANNSLSVPPQSTRMFTLVKTAAATFDLY